MSIDPGDAADNVEPAAAPPPAPAPSLPTPGELLREERERRGLSVQQVADELHLDVKVINALESNDFQLLGVPVYAKGHLRKYASLLGLSPDLVIQRYQALSDVPAVPQVVPVANVPKLRPRVSLRVPLWIVAGAVTAAGLLWLAGWLLDRLGPGGQPAQAPSSAQVVVPATAEPEQQPQLDTQPVEAPALEPQATETSPAAAPAEGMVTMRLQFSAASWTEIYDARGQRLLYGIGQQGQTRTVSGTPPLKVTLGAATAVSIEVNDRPVPVPRRAGKDAARFTVAADGSVR